MEQVLETPKKPRQYAKERQVAINKSIERIAELREDRNSGALGDEVIKMAQALILCTLPYRPTDERQVVRTARLERYQDSYTRAVWVGVVWSSLTKCRDGERWGERIRTIYG
jgi:hypothetical protein